ncbi:hypothetical protein BCR41DRAFT_368416 [Lobosporangium transversale]|uniref:histidine kinase n=1 Tax=Lobosporangium transversale TaxID=64571 RepID=A0A1Y2GX31_9FUNG|nr:hypothetical protein BCR41DRAFT_368416 [Lobosporangium transversale]ORZ26331.1 hypothetical protein BCR41DRAFT_368416 [Lobosporangium transversale]|eukprot:XP_021884096.1 hypothetical protein BCR41DRAFT_368416 [Lobosporangium transversale]
MSKCSADQEYESWDDFLYHYRQGRFPSDFPTSRPKAVTAFPPTPPYIGPPDQYLPYLAPPLPLNEEKRLRALHSFQLLRTDPDPNFEHIVQLVANVMGTKGCVITLVDHLQVSTKAQYPNAYTEAPRQHSICSHTILRSSKDPLVVLDTYADWRFKGLPSVESEPHIRFYAGAPLTTSDNLNIGVLCLYDFEPRTSFSEKDRKLLTDFAAVVMREMELWNDQAPLPTPSDIFESVPKTLDNESMYASTPLEPAFPTPTGSPTLLSCAFAPPSLGSSESTPATGGNSLQDKAFPAACIMLQATLNVDAVYLVQATDNQSIIPPSESSVVWNYLDKTGRRKGAVGVVKGGQEGLPLCTPAQDANENDWFGAPTNPATVKDPSCQKQLCHTFEGTLRLLKTGATTPYRSALIVPILGPSSSSNEITMDNEPWAYFVILSSSHTKQFSFHERIYLKNFGSCLVTEVMKKRVEAADKAKGTFIKSISHELRTPLHIILGILELLYANPEEPLSNAQMDMIATAEASGKNLIDTINNIIELANLDPDNDMETRDNSGDHKTKPAPEVEETVIEDTDIRDLCQSVAESMAKACTEKNVVVLPSWTKHSPSSLSLSTSNSATGSTTNISTSFVGTIPFKRGSFSSHEDSHSGHNSSFDSVHSLAARSLKPERKAVLELLVAMDEPECAPDQGVIWNYSLDVKSVTRILTQLVENAIKFTTAGFVEVSAKPLINSPIPIKQPYPGAQAILFTVRDTGKGISPEFVQYHLFKRFSQEDPLQVGTGLGMALVKELVRKLGGWMEVWSEGIEGRGCVVKVLLWATPASHQVKSLKKISGPWQEASCRFYSGEPSVGADRLFEIMGRRLMGQQLNMNVEKGNEEDASPEDMLKDLCDQSHCDLLVINDDLIRLKAYLSYWIDYHRTIEVGDIKNPVTPTPLLMVTSPSNVMNVQRLVDEYLETPIESESIERPASIVIMTKPIGPIKLVQCLRECFTPAFSSPHLETPHGSPRLSASSEPIQLQPMPLLCSATVPYIMATTSGVHDTRLLSAGTMIKQSFTSPMTLQGGQQLSIVVAPHSPGGLVPPPWTLPAGPSPATTPEREVCLPGSATTQADDQYQLNCHLATPQYLHLAPVLDPNLEEFRANIDVTVPKLRPRRSIWDNQAKKKQQGYVAASSTAATSTAGDTVTISSAPKSTSTSASASGSSNEDGPTKDNETLKKPVPRVLIVEDNITNRMILRTFLKKRGVSVVEAENGKIGVERFQEEVKRRGGKSGFEFVLMDLQMPVMDGNMATKRIREFEQGLMEQQKLSDLAKTHKSSSDSISEEQGYCSTIIFALTGLAGDEDKRLAFECGVDGYMTKPVSLKVLGSLMSSCMPSNEEDLVSHAGLKSPQATKETADHI